jgi:Family of unknown function (DUF6390)
MTALVPAAAGPRTGGGEHADGLLPGPVLFARYAFGPNRLGYCGTDDHAAVFGHTAAREAEPLRELARTFEGAYPYLELIAAANDIADPLDRRVVEAYWLGNALTARVRERPLHRSLDARFHPRLGPVAWRWLEAAVPEGARPVHAFHVFDVFPRIGLLRGEQVDNALAVMDSCRIRAGIVRAVVNGSLVVDLPRLELRDGHLVPGDARPEIVERWQDGIGFVEEVRGGDVVSVHWGWACDRLSQTQLHNLERWTTAELRIANRTI